MAPTQPSFQTGFWHVYMIATFCLNIYFYCSYNMARCWQAGIWKVISYKMTLEIGLICGPWDQPFHRGNFSGDTYINSVPNLASFPCNMEGRLSTRHSMHTCVRGDSPVQSWRIRTDYLGFDDQESSWQDKNTRDPTKHSNACNIRNQTRHCTVHIYTYYITVNIYTHICL